MRRVGQVRKRDYNEPEIVSALQQVGASVIRISEPGAPDLLVLWRGNLFVLEVKQVRGKLTEAQKKRLHQGWPVFIARSPKEALIAIGAMR